MHLSTSGILADRILSIGAIDGGWDTIFKACGVYAVK